MCESEPGKSGSTQPRPILRGRYRSWTNFFLGTECQGKQRQTSELVRGWFGFGPCTRLDMGLLIEDFKNDTVEKRKKAFDETTRSRFGNCMPSSC